MADPKSSTRHIPAYKASFLQSCITGGVLRFGTFELKSKRISPYFFNAGLFHRADLLRSISIAYAQSIRDYLSSNPNLRFDVLFGPAYKGIPLATATVDKLAQIDPDRFERLSYSFNRKEAKDHGEGGNIVGAPLKGKKVLIVDDVITAGTAMREAIDIIRKEGGELAGVIVALDRMEKMPSPTDDDGTPRPSAIGEVRRQYGVPVLSIITLDDLIAGLREMGDKDDIRRLEEYKARYMASDCT
ncbi:orotate phosphoribosyltransferase [Hypocenomyce scalaris]|nr:orotate phosphoribosyltransferase [Hypocenomyce scalaris]